MLKEKEKVIVLVRGSDRPNYEATGVILGHRVLDVPGSVVHGDVIYKVAIGEPHYFNYAEREIHQNDVQRFIPLPDETAAAKHAEELPLAFAAVEKALAKLMPDEKIEIKEGSIVGYHGAVTMDPVVYRTKRIGAVQESAGWQVTTWHVHPATRVQPEDVSDSPVGTHQWSFAVRKFIEMVFALKSADYWQAGDEQAAAEAWAQGEM